MLLQQRAVGTFSDYETTETRISHKLNRETNFKVET